MKGAIRLAQENENTYIFIAGWHALDVRQYKFKVNPHAMPADYELGAVKILLAAVDHVAPGMIAAVLLNRRLRSTPEMLSAYGLRVAELHAAKRVLVLCRWVCACACARPRVPRKIWRMRQKARSLVSPAARVPIKAGKAGRRGFRISCHFYTGLCKFSCFCGQESVKLP